jgi:D-alanyl-D-alanine carboxypeptidase
MPPFRLAFVRGHALVRGAALSALSGFAMAAMAVLCGGTALAQSAGPSLVVDASTGAVLHEERATQAWHPASTTKIMTAYVALRAVRAGRIGLETPIPASPLAARQPRVKVYIKPGQEITLDNALKVMMVKSANDIAYVIAEGVGGDVPTFVEMMNAEARRLGMTDTRFANPNGWHDAAQQSSARDLAVLTMALLREFPDYSDYWGIGAVQLGKVTLNNTNGLIGRYSGANGFKTGFVCASGFNVVATATRGGRTLIAVVLGAYSGAERTVKAAQILDAAFSSWSGTGRAVQSMPGSGTAASSICAEVRAFGRGAPLADDVETSGPISFTPSVPQDGLSMYATTAPAAAQPASRGAGGRLTLGPRAQFTPIQVAYGRTGGSARAPLAANVARRSGNPAESGVASTPRPATPAAEAAHAMATAPGAIGARPRSASANGAIQPAGAAPAGAVAGAVAGAAAAFAASRASAAVEAPVRLHGAIGQGNAGTGATAQPLQRPSAAAGIRPSPARPAAAPPAPAARSAAIAPAASARPNAGRAAPKPASSKPVAAKPNAAKPASAKPATAKPNAARPAPGLKPSVAASVPANARPASRPGPATSKPAVSPPARPAADE